MAILAIAAGLILALLGIYIYRRTGRQLEYLGKDPKDKRSRVIRAVITCLIIAPCFAIFTLWPFIVIVAVVSVLFTDAIAFVVRNVFAGRKRPKAYTVLSKLYRYGIFALLIMAIYLGYGYYNMNRIVPAHYEIAGSKDLKEDIRIVLIADTHYGNIQDKTLIAKAAGDINRLKPDFVVLAGDMTDEGTANEDMKHLYKVLGGMKTKYGTYFIFGNHDKQLYTDRASYTTEELEKTIEKNGIKILEDEYVPLREDIVIYGARDYYDPERKQIPTLPKGRYEIILDHQPKDEALQSEGAAGADLQLSGHTHGGQEFPIGTIMDLMGHKNYGLYKMDDYNLIVTSGFTGWGYPFRTQRHCEYVVVDVIASR